MGGRANRPSAAETSANTGASGGWNRNWTCSLRTHGSMPVPEWVLPGFLVSAAFCDLVPAETHLQMPQGCWPSKVFCTATFSEQVREYLTIIVAQANDWMKAQ